MNKYEISGGLIGAIATCILTSWQMVAGVFSIYTIALIANLLTGLFYARQTNSYSAKVAEKAVWKKFGMITAILSLMCIEWIVMGMLMSSGYPYKYPILTCGLAGYAAAHEFTSMLSNAKNLGNIIPKPIEDAAKQAEEALSQGKLPNIPGIIKNRKGE